MPTVGRATIAGNNLSRSNTGSDNQIGMKITMPEAGSIKTLHVYVAGNGSTITGQLVLWNASRAIVAQTGNITFSDSAGSPKTNVNQQAWQVADLLTPYNAASGEVLFIGFWRNSAQTANYSYVNSGGEVHPDPQGSTGNVSSPTTLASASVTAQLSAYADYIKGGLAYASGGAFSKYALKRYDGASATWKRHPLMRYNGASAQWEWYA